MKKGYMYILLYILTVNLFSMSEKSNDLVDMPILPIELVQNILLNNVDYIITSSNNIQVVVKNIFIYLSKIKCLSHDFYVPINSDYVYELIGNKLKQKFDFNDKDDLGQCFLVKVSGLGYLQAVKLALLGGADINSEGEMFKTALMNACENNRKAVVKFLIFQGACLDIQQDFKLNTALMLASKKGYSSIIKILLHNNVNINLKNHAGYTALMIASERGYVEIVKLLISHDFEDIIFDSKEFFKSSNITCIMGPKYSYPNSCILALSLKARGPVVNTKSLALMLAVISGHKDLVEILVNSGVDVNVQDRRGKTALMIALKNNNMDIALLLLCAAGIDVNVINNKGKVAHNYINL